MSWIAVRSRLKGHPPRSVLTQTCYAIFRREASRRFRRPIDIQQEVRPMVVQVPTPDQLRAVADEMGLSLTGADVDSFINLMRPSVAAYNVVDSIPDNLPVKYPRMPGLPSAERGEQAQCLVRQDRGRRRAQRKAQG